MTTAKRRAVGLILGSLCSLMGWSIIASLVLLGLTVGRSIDFAGYKSEIAIFVMAAAVLGMLVDWFSYLIIRARLQHSSVAGETVRSVISFFLWRKYKTLWGHRRNNGR